MDCHESALDAIYEDDIFFSDVEEGELEDGECSGLQPMDVDRADRGLISEGEISAQEDGPSPGETVDGINGEYKVFNFKGCSPQRAIDTDASGSIGNATRRPKRSKRRRSGNRKRVDLGRFVRQTCEKLQEKKIHLIWALVKKLGVNAVRDLVEEVNAIEKCGGQMTNGKERRRIPGGVLLKVLQERVPEVYKEIKKLDNEVLKQKAKANNTLKRQRMDVDEAENKKRRKVTGTDGRTGGKQVAWPTPCAKVPQDFSTLTDAPVRDDCRLPTALIQRAWVEGLRKKDDLDDVRSTRPGILESGSEITKFSTVSVNPSEKVVNVVDRLRVPVVYSDLEKGVHDEDDPGEHNPKGPNGHPQNRRYGTDGDGDADQDSWDWYHGVHGSSVAHNAGSAQACGSK